MELARCEASAAVFIMVNKIPAVTIELFGSKKQKEYYLPKLSALELTGACIFFMKKLII